MGEPRIAILDPEVVNQIAAGEVVERPASVVKELVENALDAGAKRIDVQVEQGGQKLVRVTDDGCGMSPLEAELSLRRHATSKLRCVDDLLGVRTMGFRGEALPSIASVSRLSLLSRPRDHDAGSRLAVEGGETIIREPAGCPVGTVIEVRELFFNTPARLKFLKSTATEAAHISDAIAKLALAHPAVHFTLVQDGRKTMDLPSCANRIERARSVLGRRGDRLFMVGVDEGGLSAEACLAPPEQSTRSARSVHLLVNHRTVRDRALVHAVSSGYGELLERGRYPLAILYLEIDGRDLDVNVHPQKVEVRFAEPSRVYAAIRSCVRDGLARSPFKEQVPPARVYRIKTETDAAGYEEHKKRIQEATRRFWSARRDNASWDWAKEVPPIYQRATEQTGGYFGSLRIVGQVMGTYMVCEGDQEIVLVDQHAAHERAIYERLRRAHVRGRMPSQRLLVPETVILDDRLEATAKDHASVLEQLGFELEPFGGTTWTLRAVPGGLECAEPAALVRDVLEELAGTGGSELVSEARDAVLARMACHGSVRAGTAMSHQEMMALLASMDQVDFSANCPHGRPVMVRLPRSELERRFGRS